MKTMYKYLDSYKFYIKVSLSVLCMITTLISVGFGALNQDLNIAGDVEYIQDAGNMIRSWVYSSADDFHSSRYKSKIKPKSIRIR